MRLGNWRGILTMLTAVQQDYIEVVYRLELAGGPGTVRLSDIADQLGTRRPTVTRTVHKLTRLGLLEHESRRGVSLSPTGRRMAVEILHRHEDLAAFFADVLGLARAEADANACRIEHGLSSRATQRLHEWLEYVSALSAKEKRVLQRFLSQASAGSEDFDCLPEHNTSGWRI